MTLLLLPMTPPSHGSSKMFATLNQDELYELHLADLLALERQVTELKAAECFYADAADNFVKYIRKTIHESSMSKKLHNEFIGILATTKTLLATPVFNNNQQINPEFTKCANQLDTQMNKVQSYKKGNIGIGVAFVLIAAIAIAAMITLCVLNPVVSSLIFMPMIFGLIGAKPSIMAGFSFNHAFQAHGLLKNAKPLVNMVQDPLANIKINGNT